MNLDNRVKKLEQTSAKKQKIAVWYETQPDIYSVDGIDFPSSEAAQAAYPDYEIVVLRVVYGGKA